MIRLAPFAAGAVCAAAGVYMLTIESASADPTVFEAMAHGIGVYFIGKGVFVWAMLTVALKQSDQTADLGDRVSAAAERREGVDDASAV